MKPQHIKSKRRKEVRQLFNELDRIRDEKKALGYAKLEKPIRHGWYKEMVLTENIERYKNQDAMLEIYKVLNRSFWGRTKQHCDKEWNAQISIHLIYRGLPTISKKQFNRLSLKAQKLCTVFKYREEKSKKVRYRFYVRIPKNAYRIRYQRAYVTHTKIIDPALESRGDLIWQAFKKSKYYAIYSEGYCYKEWRTTDFKKEKLRTKRELKKLVSSWESTV